MHSQGNQAPAASRRDSEALALRSQKSNTELLRRLFKFVTPNEKRTLGAACVAMTFTSLTNLAFPKLVAWLVDGMAKQEPPRRRFLCSALLLFGAGAIGSWLRTYLFAIVNESISTRLRVALVQHILAQVTAPLYLYRCVPARAIRLRAVCPCIPVCCAQCGWHRGQSSRRCNFLVPRRTWRFSTRQIHRT